jgi:uncharacterized membrane protein
MLPPGIKGEETLEEVMSIGESVRYSFTFLTGNFENLKGHGWFGQIFCVVSWIFISVMLMNLLISIISEVYAKNAPKK